jgi:hypothetical protein
MDKNSAVKLLNETFNKDFDVNRYLTLIKELFNNFSVREYSSIIWKEYQNYIENYKSFGTYTDSSKKVVDVLVVKLKKTSSRDRARTMQRNFIAKYLGNAEKDAALVAFYGDDEDWRFSFVKMEYNLVKDDTGKVKVAKELTPAKRYSFLVGVNEPNHTAQQQLYPLLKEEDVNPTLEQIEHAFSIERVTKEFFDKYKGLFLKLKESLEKVVKKDNLIKEEFDRKNISIVDFSKKLLGQIVFIYFLQKKGWLGVERGEKWGTGPKNFMRELLGDKDNKPLIKYKNFFNEILEPLFYDALANSREGDDGYHTHFKCKIPFLNGGLFEPMNDYDWVKTDILLDNSIFEDILKTFDEFNFTVKEDEPLEKEVAVDPEMLGKVFENLLDVIDRKSKGAFYTPREIVYYMCQQSLINYLETNSEILREDIEKFIQLGDFSTSNDERVLEDIKSKQDKLKKGIINASTFDTEVKQLIEKISLPKSIIENKEKIDDLLKEIKVVDPAVGSGAFPVGMLNEIVKARLTLSIFLVKQRNDYDLKREIIENCLYGVDIDSSAVDITKLRFWLSLIVDELDMKNIKPLPNLDHKIMCGNSLLEEFEGKKLFDEKLLGEIKRNFGKELKEISTKISELYTDQEDDFEKQLSKLKRQRKKIETEARKDRESSQATLNDSISMRIKESQVKLRELKKLQKEFFNEENKKLKKEHRERIDELEWELVEETLKEEGNEEAIEKLQEYKKNKSKPFFLWKLYFAEVFQRENPGFDVVIGNPPYVSSWNAEKEYKDYFVKNYKSATGHYDLYVLFLEKAIELLREKGTSSFITSNKFFSQKYGLGIRNILLENKICEIINFNCNVFETATVETAINIIKKEEAELKHHTLILDINQIKDYNFSKKQPIRQNFFREMPNNSFRLNLNDEKISVIKKIEIGTTHFENLCYIDCGIVPHSSKFDLKKEYFIHSENKEGEYKKYLEGKNISRNHIPKKTRFFNYQPTKHHRPKFKELFENNKILIKDIGGKAEITSVVDEDNHYTNDTIRIAVLLYDLSNLNNSQFRVYTKGKNIHLSKKYNIKFLQAIISSKMMGFYFFELICGGLHIYPNEIRLFPIKQSSDEQQKPFIQLVDQILSITKDYDYLDNPDKKAKVKRLEKKIDQFVYKLYNLTSEEIKIVEGFNNRK